MSKNLSRWLLFTMIVFLIIYKFCLAQTSTADIAYKVVYKKEFDENINSANWNLDKVAEKNLKKQHNYSALNPSMIVQDKKISFYDGNNNLILTKDTNYWVTKSLGYNYAGVAHITKYDASGYMREGFFEVYDNKGQLKFHLNVPMYDEYSLDFKISDNNGYVVQADPFSAEFVFRDPKGNVLNEVALFSRDLWSTGRQIVYNFNKNGDRFAVAVNKLGEHDGGINLSFYSETDNTYLFFFDNYGTEKWREQILEPIQITSQLIMSDDGNYILFDYSIRNKTEKSRDWGVYLYTDIVKSN